MGQWISKWKDNALWISLKMFWLATVAASFWGQYLFPITVSKIGTMYAFRILLLITAVLYLFWAVCKRNFFWKDTTSIEKWCYIFIAVMLIYGIASLPLALDIIHTSRKLFNLCFDLCFFFLLLHLCRKEKMLQATLEVGMISVATLCVLGIYEVFSGSIFPNTDILVSRFILFNKIYNSPIVTGGNVNNYCCFLLFTFAAYILMALRKKEQRQWELAVIVFFFPVLYFLLLAASSELNLVALALLLVGIFTHFLICDRRRLWLLLIAVVLIGGIRFANQYQYIVPPIREYLLALQEFKLQMSDSVGEHIPSRPPNLIIGDPKTVPLVEEFYQVNQETGELELREDGTGGVRTRLLLHAFNCFRESHGLGVGLGNTEILARERQITKNGVWSIHCFIARIIADFGIFILFPLCVIVFMLLRQLFYIIKFGWKDKKTFNIGYALCYFCTLCAYPFLSTSPSDAQDIISMWLYLGAVVMLCQTRQVKRKGIFK